MSKDNTPPDWRARLQGWAQKAGDTLEDLKKSPVAERVSQAGRIASAQMSDTAERVSDIGKRATSQAKNWAVWKETGRITEQIRESPAWKQIEARAQQVRSGTQSMARETGQRLEKLQHEAESLFSALDEVGKVAGNRAAALRLATQIFEQAGPHLDLLADAVAVGSAQEAGVGLASFQGTEVYFVPPDGPVRAQLRVHRIVGQTARLAVGGQMGAYVAAFYGPRDLLTRSLERRGADLGLIALSLGFFQATATESKTPRAGGWLMELAAGLSLGIPIISDLSAFELEEVPLASYSLDNKESAAIEEALAQSPDRSLRRNVARRLAGDADGKAG